MSHDQLIGWAILIGAVVGCGTCLGVICICAVKALGYFGRKIVELGRSGN